MTALFLAVMVLITGAVVLVDPFFHYHAPLAGFPYQVDNQLSQNPGMARHMEYDSVILGSSMTVNFNTEWFREEMNLNTRKLCYSGAYPKDQANIMDQIYRSDNRVDAVFLGVDVITYSGAVDETKYPLPEYLYDDVLWNDVSYLWNKDVLLNYILRPIADPEPTDLATVYSSWWTDDYYNIQWVMHGYEPPAASPDEKPVDYFTAAVEENMDRNICPYIEAHPETTFYIFFPPYSILFWNNALVENRLEATLQEYRCITDKVIGYDNVRVFFFNDMEDVVTDLNRYADYTHYHPDINHYMTECFADGTYEIKDCEELEEHIGHLKKIISTFNFDELFSVDWG